MPELVTTELLLHPLSAKRWQVVERPSGQTTPIAPGDIKVLTVYSKKELALAFAEGRQSVTGQPIRMEGTW